MCTVEKNIKKPENLTGPLGDCWLYMARALEIAKMMQDVITAEEDWSPSLVISNRAFESIADELQAGIDEMRPTSPRQHENPVDG